METMPSMSALWLCQVAQTSAAVLLTGTAVLSLLTWGTDLDAGATAGWRRLAAGSWAVVLAAAGGQLVLTAAAMSGLPWRQACTREVLRSVVEGTRFGGVWLARMGVLGVLGAGWMAARGRRRKDGRVKQRTVKAGAVLLAGGLMATLVWAGHAGSAGSRGWLLPVGVAHAVAAGVWPGGLVPLAVLLAKTRREAGLVPGAVTVTRRFSQMSVLTVGVLAASGSLNGWALVGTWSGLVTSVYGWLVLSKAGLFAAMVGAGAVNRRLVVGGAGGTGTAETLRRLRRNVLVECALAGLVLLATEALAMSAPPGGG